MYIPVSLGIVAIIALCAIMLGNLLVVHKIFRRSLDHSEKCGCCGKKDDGPDVVGAAKTVMGAVSKLV